MTGSRNLRAAAVLASLLLLVLLAAACALPEKEAAQSAQAATATPEPAVEAQPTEAAAEAPAADTQEESSEETASPDFAGTYQATLPAADSPGRQITLVLADDNGAEMTTDYMNGEAPIVQNGTWEANDDGTATAVFTEQDGQLYLMPETITFALDGDQLLAIVYDQTVYGAEGLQLEKTEQTQQEAASPDAPTPEFVGTYQTMLPAADSPGRQITLVLADDNSAQMTTDYMNGEAPIVQTGTWEANDDGTATMTLTAQDGNPYDEPQVITFSMDGDQLDAIVYDRSAYGEEGLHLAKTEQSEQEAATPDFVAVYEAMLPAADSPGRHITLVVGADNTVQMTTDYMNGEDPIVQEGTWQLNDDRTVTVTITGQDGQLYIEPKTITFSLDDDRLAAIDYDLTIYGKNGLKLERQGKPGEMRPAPKRAFLTIDLEAGFALDPFLVSVNAGGTIDASGLSPDCTGYISANPVVSVNWTGEADLVKAFFYSDHDATLVIQAPDGQYHCNDDANALLLDPMIELDSPPQGQYHIWLGSYSDNQLLPGVLVLTTRPDVSVGTFSLEGLVKRPALPDVLAAPEPRLAATLLTDALANYKGSTVDLAAGGDETSMSVTAEGDIAAFDVPLEGVTCTGYIPAKPDLVFDWSGQADSLQFFFEGDADTTLVVIAPGGKVFCTDDAEPGSNVNPLLVVHDPLEGRYAVFVGRVHPENPVQGTLTVGDDLSSAPRILAPGDQ